MRMMPSRYAGKAEPFKVKKNAASIGHVTAPLKGLSLSTKLSQNSDPLKATILDNWLLDEDKIRCRNGYILTTETGENAPVESLVPYYGTTQNLLLGVNNKLITYSGTVLKDTGIAGFNDWSWTSFSNLGDKTYTIMCNGANGVWSWDGTNLVAGLVKETVTAPASAAWVNPNKLYIVLAHQNRLWFADNLNLAVYYLPLQQKAGALAMLPLNAIFKRGGIVQAIYSWTVDGGDGMNDRLVIFSSNGECAIYSGTDPDSDYSLDGVFRFDSPMSKHCVAQYGGELYVLISTGLVPMSTLMRIQAESLGQTDKDVFSAFMTASRKFRNVPGWQVILDPSSSRLICNLPAGGSNHYGQMVRFMPNDFWTSWSGLPSRSWAWLGNQLYFGSDKGRLFSMSRLNLSDNGKAIKVDVQFAWSNFKTAGVKHFKMMKPYIITDGNPKPAVDMQVDYKTYAPVNQPDLSFASGGAYWNTGTWDVDDWAPGSTMVGKWSGVGRLGTVGAVRLQALIKGCEFSISGCDILYETGSALG